MTFLHIQFVFCTQPLTKTLSSTCDFLKGSFLIWFFFKKSIMNPWILLNKYIFVKFEKKTMTRLRFKKLIYPSGFVALIYLGIWHVKRERFCVLDGDKQVKTSSSFSNEGRVRLLTKIMNLSLFYRRWKLIKHLSYFQSFLVSEIWE